MKPMLLIYLILCWSSTIVKAQNNDSMIGQNDKSGWKSMVDLHLGSIPYIYGGKVGVGIKYKKVILDFDYFSFPFYTSNNEVSLSVSGLTNKQGLKKSFTYGVTFMHSWDVNYPDDPPSYQTLPGYNSYLLYPYIGYYNQQLAHSIFCLSLRGGVIPFFRYEYNIYTFAGLAPFIDISVGVRLWHSGKR